MKRLTSIIIALGLTMTMQAQNRSNGYPITQVPFTAVKVTPNTFWGDRIHAAREVTIPWLSKNVKKHTVTRISTWRPTPCSTLGTRG